MEDKISVQLTDVTSVYVEGGFVELTGVLKDELIGYFDIYDIIKYFGKAEIEDILKVY